MQTDGEVRLRGMLGFAMRAGKVTLGTENVCKLLAGRKAVLVVCCRDASEGTKKKLRTKCEFYNVELREIEIDTGELGSLLGKTYGPAAAAITDDRFAKEIVRCLATN
ncbi:MAG: ribosomal L7Ae/L30e/S12e/Gadd45 family protein [Clostridia bacterium]|nr:ribosomal L7Ae/L30e/S12e/Gadd45 family protein [Clostridia bacterium]